MAQRKTQRKTTESGPVGGEYTVTDLAQVRALANPLRLRILAEFAAGPHTTKQVAVALGENPTRLYHHVETLAAVGLIELKETRAKRGTVERYYQAIAPRFAVGPSALSAFPQSRSEPLPEMIRSILDVTRDELTRSCQAASAEGESAEDAPLVARGLVVGSKKQIVKLRGQLLRLLQREPSAQSSAGKKGTKRAQDVTYALTIAYYRVS
jgi:DNA-binding transcriptional ArsR family regulator